MNFNITTACIDMALSAGPSFALSYLIYKNTNQALVTAGIAAGASLVDQIAQPYFKTITQKWPISTTFFSNHLITQVAYNLTRSFTKTQDLVLSVYQTRFLSVMYLIHVAKFPSCYLYTGCTREIFNLNDVWKLSGRITLLV